MDLWSVPTVAPLDPLAVEPHLDGLEPECFHRSTVSVLLYGELSVTGALTLLMTYPMAGVAAAGSYVVCWIRLTATGGTQYLRL